MGDWGRNGLYNQSLVAAAMGRVAEDLDFVLSVGDNFYESGLTSVLDPQFEASFKDVYTAPSLQVTLAADLGQQVACQTDGIRCLVGNCFPVVLRCPGMLSSAITMRVSCGALGQPCPSRQTVPHETAMSPAAMDRCPRWSTPSCCP